MATRVPFIIGLSCWFICFICTAVAFGTGNWFESEGSGRLFTRLGLWEACFDGYEHTSDYIGKAYHGCWWIFHKEYSYIKSWILPSWFVAVQTLMSLAITSQMLGFVIVPLSGRQQVVSSRGSILAFGLSFFNWLCLSISIVVFGTMVGEDRTWMPRPDEDRMGWSFGMAVIAAFFASFATIALGVHMSVKRYYERLQEYDENYKKENSSDIAMSHYRA